MRLRKLIVLGALVAFTGGMMSCSKKTDENMTDSTAVTAPEATPTTAPPPPPATMDTMHHDSAAMAPAAAPAEKK
jgi:hypothetical protein